MAEDDSSNVNLDDVISKLNRGMGGVKLDEKVMDFLFSNDEHKILQTTDLDAQGLRMATVLESLDHFIIKDYCLDLAQASNFRDFKKKIYQMRVSKDRKGRQEFFDSIKSSVSVMMGKGDKNVK
jgi:hypothetical protein